MITSKSVFGKKNSIKRQIVDKNNIVAQFSFTWMHTTVIRWRKFFFKKSKCILRMRKFVLKSFVLPYFDSRSHTVLETLMVLLGDLQQEMQTSKRIMRDLEILQLC
jgi:hypothetical protein